LAKHKLIEDGSRSFATDIERLPWLRRRDRHNCL